MTNTATRVGAWLALTLAAATPVRGQQALADAEALERIEAFCKRAHRAKAHTLARRAWRLVVLHYDENHTTANEALGHTRNGDVWSDADPKPMPPDEASPSRLRQAAKDWDKTCRALARHHKQQADTLQAAGNDDDARRHFARVLLYAPADVDSHKALGHGEIDGFYGNEEELGLVSRMRVIRNQARRCARREVSCSELASSKMPAPLQASGLKFYGVRSEHFVHWVCGTPEQARASIVWAERGLAFVRFLLGKQSLADQAFDPAARSYLVVLRSTAQRDALLAKAPELRGGFEPEQIAALHGVSFADGDRTAEWCVSQPDDDADRMVAHVTMRCAGQRLNQPLSEGLVHTVTWMMCDTVRSRYAELPHTESSKKDEWPRDPKVWRQRLEDAIAVGSDWPLGELPRERMENFREPARVKAWSFCVWLVARHHEDWLDLLAGLHRNNMLPADVDEVFGDMLGWDVAECEREWRTWARRDSALGRISGWH